MPLYDHDAPCVQATTCMGSTCLFDLYKILCLCQWQAQSWHLSHILSWCSSSDLPNFFASTKFFACLDLLESKELFEATEMVQSLSEPRFKSPLCRQAAFDNLP